MANVIIIILFFAVNLSAQGEPLVDPTKPLNFQQTATKKVYRAKLPTLQSIIIKQGKHQAILNNNIYQKGEWINGYQITQIDAEKVLLKYQKSTYRLTLYSSKERYSH